MHRAMPVSVRVDTPMGGFIKRRDDGGIDYISPLPCPFNYGCVPDTPSADGDALDAVLLGARVGGGTTTTSRAWAVVDFVDAGCEDPKLICADEAPSRSQRARVMAFFRAYAWLKAALNAARGTSGVTAYRGWRWLPDEGGEASKDRPCSR